MPNRPLTFAPPRRRRFFRWRTLVIVVVLALVAAGVYWFFVRDDSSSAALPGHELDTFLTAWSHGDTATMASAMQAAPAPALDAATSLVKSAPRSSAKYTRTSLVRTKTGATGTYHARVELPAFGQFEWDGTLTFVRVPDGKQKVWKIESRPDVFYPGLGQGEQLQLRVTWPARGSIFANDGSLLAGNQSVVTIGLEPDRVTKSLPQIKQLMKQLVGTDPARIDAALHAPGIKPNYFVPIDTVPDDARYTTVLRPQLAPIPGVFFQRSKGVLTTSGNLDPVVGRVGEITAEMLQQLGPPYRAGDQVGLTGLQLAFERRLAGTPTGDVVVTRGTKVVRTVHRYPGKAAQSVRLTIDAHTQAAAEGALAAVTQPAALVAVDVSTGAIRAMVSKPDGGFDRALDGTYPPGSTFKVVTSAALLAAGKTATTPAPCPPTLPIQGHTFHNFEGEASGSLDLAHAFAISCNNAFIGLADTLPAGALQRAAASFGFNAPWKLPVPSVGGSFPNPVDRVDAGASAIGQGRVTASPAQMASVAGAVAAGQWHQPVLTTEPAPTVVKVPALDPAVVATLRSFMASVVQPGGTAAGAGLPAGTAGKTGTAEFGNDNPPKTHAWFIGYRGDLAFAIVVEGGGVGGRVAAPLAAQFLHALG